MNTDADPSKQPTLFESITGHAETPAAPASTFPDLPPKFIAGRAYCQFCKTVQNVINVGGDRLLFDTHPSPLQMGVENRRTQGYYCNGSRMLVQKADLVGNLG